MRLDRIMVCLYLAVAAAPVVAMKLGLHDHAINGALFLPPDPELSFTDVTTEKLQHDVTAWFESRLGLKGYAIATDNAILYRAFGDTKPGSEVVIGKHGVLFKDEDVAHYNNNVLPDPARVELLADRLADMQQRLAARHRAFVPLIVPGKSLLYRDEIPARWIRDVGEPRPVDAIYASLVRALDARHVVYADAHAILKASTFPREQLWGIHARHWSYLGACLAMEEVNRDYAKLTGKPPMKYDCPFRMRWRTIDHDDFDLVRLLNMWSLPHRPQVPVLDHEWPRDPDNGASILFIGTSFMWTTVKDASESHVMGPKHFDSYNKILVAWPQNTAGDVVAHTKAWRDVFLTQDIYVLDLFEEYLFVPTSYVDAFLADIEPELADPADEPTTGASIGEVRDLGVTDGAHYFELWGSFPNPGKPYTATITCNEQRRTATVYYQNPNGQQLNVSFPDPGPGTCDRTQTPPRATGVSCSFKVIQRPTIGSPAYGPRRVCPGPQGQSGQDADGTCIPGLRGC